ncbi:Pre-rRNA-processing protein TSR2 like protein [Argiope bruennichi]|uniref:Pre-rRNA-processing protein TSR2 homolog n=1 Tax=Argiope bruennichi TaxID=94029 RepID=A0A8T0EWT8_ARGBR|nr:Pre-rRNA-processing protein TSR2 like protein [Argiope bruennichi]
MRKRKKLLMRELISGHQSNSEEEPDSDSEVYVCESTDDYVGKDENVQPDEIEDYVGAMIENEFNTYFEDGSLQQVSRNFCAAYPLSLTNPDADIFQEMRNKPVIKPSSNVKSSQDSSEPTHQEQMEQATCEKMEQLTVSENKEDDGWTVVSRKNKNK